MTDATDVCCEGFQFLTGSGIPQTERLVPTAADEIDAVGRERQRHNIMCMSCECGELPSSLSIPKFDSEVNAATGEGFTIGC